MQKITSILEALKNNPSLNSVSFRQGDDFKWEYPTQTVWYAPDQPDTLMYLLHEAGHAVLQHQEYPDDISLLIMEREAWNKATELGSVLAIPIDVDTMEDALDSYRDWLHARSTCPHCQSTGIQTSLYAYDCLACHHKWKVNEARSCALRRYAL